MLRLRPKMGPAGRNKEWNCCICLHVRTATICLGIWHLLLHIIALSVLALILHSPALMNQLEHPDGTNGLGDSALPPLPTPLSKVDPSLPYKDHSLNYHDVDMGALVTVCTLAITLMMLYGAVKQRPSHLLPFFCLQLFDFAITTLTATGYLCYLRSVHRLVAESRHLPWREELLQLSPQALSLLVLLTFVAAMLVKAYFIGIVWRCYKYLTMRQHALRTMLPYVIPEVMDLDRCRREQRDYSSLLPDYEEAVKQVPPPSYQAAVASVETPGATSSAAEVTAPIGAQSAGASQARPV